MNETTVGLVVGIACAALGWMAHGVSIKEDCKSLNGFIVGNTVFVCEVKK